jgi:oligopeptide/dipeptide ABC transporter ATP-binding protein
VSARTGNAVGSELLEVDDIRVSIASKARGRELRLIDGVSFSLSRGESMGIVGESGSGKTMTALAIMRLLPKSGRISGGTVRFLGGDLRTKSAEEMRAIRGAKIAMILQDPLAALDPLFTIGSQLVEVMRIHLRVSHETAAARGAELLAAVGIPDPATRMHQYPHQMSGGMLQRIVGAMAISCNPDLLIADEPTTALDPTIQAQFIDVLNGLKAEKQLALLLVTHDFGVAGSLCDKIIVMYAGRIVERAATRELFDRPRHPYTQALLAAIPDGDWGASKRLPTVPGQPPDVGDRPPGCAFASRCRYAHEQCHSEPPEFMLNDSHGVACWLAEDDCRTS